MKVVILTLCFFIALINFANAGELYSCIDSNGNTIITDIRKDGMRNCVLKDSYEKPSAKEPTNEKRKVIVKAKEIPKASMKRIKNCIKCCNDKIRACYNYIADQKTLCCRNSKRLYCHLQIKRCFSIIME